MQNKSQPFIQNFLKNTRTTKNIGCTLIVRYSGVLSASGMFMSVAPPLVRRFVAGTTWQDVMPHCESLAAQGIRTTLNILGEDYRGEQESRAVLREYLDLIARMDGRNSYLSIKLTMLGLMHSEELTCELLDSLLQESRGTQCVRAH